MDPADREAVKAALAHDFPHLTLEEALALEVMRVVNGEGGALAPLALPYQMDALAALLKHVLMRYVRFLLPAATIVSVYTSVHIGVLACAVYMVLTDVRDDLVYPDMLYPLMVCAARTVLVPGTFTAHAFHDGNCLVMLTGAGFAPGPLAAVDDWEPVDMGALVDVVPPPPVLAPLAATACVPGAADACGTCAAYVATVACLTCGGQRVCVRCVDGGDGGGGGGVVAAAAAAAVHRGHVFQRLSDCTPCVDMTDDDDEPRQTLAPRRDKAALCGHRDSWTQAACVACAAAPVTFARRSASCDICCAKEEGDMEMMVACSAGHAVCQACWARMTSTGDSAACPYCRVKMV